MAGLSTQKIQLGRESTAGTAVAATTVWRGPAAGLKPDNAVNFVTEDIGVGTRTNRAYVAREGATLSLPIVAASFEQLPHLFEMGLATATPTQDGAGSDYIYTYTIDDDTVPTTLKTYTIETGDSQQAEEAEYCFAEQITLSGSGTDAVMMSANIRGRQVSTASFTGALSAPDVETIIGSKGSLYIDANSGSFGGTQVSGTLFDWTCTIDTGWTAKYLADDGQLYFNYAYFNARAFGVTLDLTYEHDTNAVAEKAAHQAGTARLIRLRVNGDAVTTPGTTYSTAVLILDVAGTYDNVDALGETDGNSIVKCRLRSGYDATADAHFKAIVVNELSSLP